MFRFLIFGFGVLLCCTGLLFIMLYLNLLTMGYSFLQYVNFIIRRFECACLVIGVILIFLSFERWKTNELFLRCFNKSK